MSAPDPGRRRLLQGAVAAVFIGQRGADAQDVPRFRAVLIAVTQYEGAFSAQPQLAGALPAMEASLRALALRAGYQPEHVVVTRHTDTAGSLANATDSEIVRSVSDAARASLDGDSLVVFFTGHGTTSADGRMYLHTSKAHDQIPADRIDLREQIVRLISKLSRASINLILVDACRSPAGPGALGPTPPLVPSAEALASLKVQGVATYLAASEGEQAWVNVATGYGFFTEEVAAALQAADVQDVQKLASMVGPSVYRRVKDAFPGTNRSQKPALSVDSSAGGSYVLVRHPAPAAGQSATAPRQQPSRVHTIASTSTVPIQLTGPTHWIFNGDELRISGAVSTNGHPLTIKALRLVGEQARLIGPATAAASGAPGADGQSGRDGTGAGQSGDDGRAGSDGFHGEPGRTHGAIDIEVSEMTGGFEIEASGQTGGAGGQGGRGGRGGDGARGEASQPGLLDCASGPGHGGRGGSGGKGGSGGNGGNGGQGAGIRIAVRRNLSAKLLVTAKGATGGEGGAGGTGGAPGAGGPEGALRGRCNPAGRQGPAGAPGERGRSGRIGEPGVDGWIEVDSPAISTKVKAEFDFRNS